MFFKFGWKKDIQDSRDYTFRKYFSLVDIAPKSDLRNKCSLVEDQENLGSCVAQSIAGGCEFLDLKDPTFTNVSRLFIYYNAREIEGTTNYDSGAYIRDGIKGTATKGVCSEQLWPYNIGKFDDKPTQECYTDALDHKITHYFRILDLNEMRKCLSDGYPFVFGFIVYKSFVSDRVTNTGIVEMPSWMDKFAGPIGGHAVLAVGHDDSTKRFIVRNSWGKDWGMNGYFTIPYKYLTNSKLSNDFWTIRKMEGTN